MKEHNEVLAAKPAVRRSVPPPNRANLPPRLIIGCLALVACFGVPLYQWVRFALQSELYSYTLLVPFISIYLFSLTLKRPSASESGTFRGLAVILLLLGGASMAAYWATVLAGIKLIPQDSVALATVPFVLMLAGVCALFLGKATFRGAVFPLAFLLFMAPFPLAMEHLIEAFLQQGSAFPAYWLFKIAGTPIFRQDLVFQLPGMTLQIAPECSGIRSTLVLFMTSLVAGHMFLSSPWRRTVLTVVVIPLALVRNGFRVFTIGELCVHVGPHMIDSAVHHKGGPIFFALSLIPFSILVFFLVKSDRSSDRARLKPIAS